MARKKYIGIIFKRLLRRIRNKYGEGFCDSCGSRGRHSFDCKHITWDGLLEEVKNYHEAWEREQRFSDGYRRQVVEWQGKYSMVKHENNKLRKKLYRKMQSDDKEK